MAAAAAAAAEPKPTVLTRAMVATLAVSSLASTTFLPKCVLSRGRITSRIIGQFQPEGKG
jgi:hypothetical protein